MHYHQIKLDTLAQFYPGLLLWKKDIKSAFTESTDALAQLLGFKNNKEIIGATNYDAPCKIAEWADKFVQQDAIVIEKQKSLQTVEIHPYTNKNQWHALLMTKLPLLNRDNSIVGTHGYCIDITNAFEKLAHHLSAINVALYHSSSTLTNSFFITESYSDLNLSKREVECLFYIVRGKTAKEIGKILHISPRTVQAHIENMKLKLHCKTKSELIDNIIKRGLIYIIPRGLLGNHASIKVTGKY